MQNPLDKQAETKEHSEDLKAKIPLEGQSSYKNPDISKVMSESDPLRVFDIPVPSEVIGQRDPEKKLLQGHGIEEPLMKNPKQTKDDAKNPKTDEKNQKSFENLPGKNKDQSPKISYRDMQRDTEKHLLQGHGIQDFGKLSEDSDKNKANPNIKADKSQSNVKPQAPIEEEKNKANPNIKADKIQSNVKPQAPIEEEKKTPVSNKPVSGYGIGIMSQDDKKQNPIEGGKNQDWKGKGNFGVAEEEIKFEERKILFIYSLPQNEQSQCSFRCKFYSKIVNQNYYGYYQYPSEPKIILAEGIAINRYNEEAYAIYCVKYNKFDNFNSYEIVLVKKDGEHKEQINTKRLIENVSIIFIYDLKFDRRVRSLWFDLAAPGKSVTNEEALFLYIDNFIEKNQNDFVLKVLDHFSKTSKINDNSKHNIFKLFNSINNCLLKKISNEFSDEIIIKTAKIILPLKLSIRSVSELPAFFFSQILSIIKLNPEKWQKHLQTPEIKEIILLSILVVVEKNPQNISMDIFDIIDAKDKTKVIKLLLENLATSKIIIQGELATFLRNAIDNEKDQKLQLYIQLLKITSNLEEAIEIVIKLNEVDQNSNRNYNYYWNYNNSEIQKGIYNFVDRMKVNINNFLGFIKIIEEKGKTAKNLFYEPHFKNIFSGFLEEKNLDEDKLRIIGVIYSKPNLNSLFIYNPFSQFTENLIRTKKFSFSTIFKTLLNNDVNKSKQFIKYYASQQKRRYGKSFIKEIEEDLMKIEDNKKSLELIKEAFDVILFKADNYNTDIFEIAPFIEDCKTEEIKKDYIKILFKEISELNEINKENYALSKLRRIFKDRNRNTTYVEEELKKIIFNLVKIQDINKVELRERIFKQASTDDREYVVLCNIEYITDKNLTSILIEYFDSILSDFDIKKLTFKEAFLLKDQSKDSRKAFITIIEAIAEIKKKKVEVEKRINEIIEIIVTIHNKKECIKKFIEKILNDATDYETLKKAYVDFEGNFDKMIVNTAEIPNILKPIDVISFEIKIVLESHVFRNSYIQGKNIKKTSTEIIIIVRQAYAEMYTEINLLYHNLNEFRLKRFEELITEKMESILSDELAILEKLAFKNNQAQGHVADIKAQLEGIKKLDEIKYIGNLNNISSELNIFEKCISHYAEYTIFTRKLLSFLKDFENYDEYNEVLKPMIDIIYDNVIYLKNCYGDIDKISELKHYSRLINLIKYCESILELKNSIDFSDNQILNECENYKRYCVNERDTLKCQKYLELSKMISESLSIQIVSDLQFQSATSILNFSSKLNSCQELIQFCKNLKEEEIDYLKESVNDYEEGLVSAQQIIDLEEIWVFLTKIKGIKSYSEYRTLTLNYKKDINTSIKSRDFLVELTEKIDNCNLNITSLKEFHQDLNLKEEAKKKQICEINKKSEFMFFKEKFSHNVELFYIIQGQKKHTKKLVDLLELKDRAALMTNINTEEGPRISINIENADATMFIKFVSCITSTIDCLNKLTESGYPNIKLPDENFICIESNYLSLEKFNEELVEMFKEWMENLKNAYCNYPILSRLCGKQFWILEKYFEDNTCQEKARSLLKYIEKIDKPLNFKKEANLTVLERMTKLGDAQSSSNYSLNFEQKIFQEQNQVTWKSGDNILEGILTLYLQANYSFPRSDQILFCTRETSSRELLSFIYRLFGDKDQQLYTIVNCELMSYENQMKFIEYFTMQFDNGSNEDFRLGIVSKDGKNQVIEFFRYHKKISLMTINSINFISPEQVENVIKTVDRNSLCVISTEAGFGKTFFIKNKVQNEHKVLKVVSIVGEITLTSLTKKICKLNVVDSCALLLKINTNTDPELVNEMIMKLSLYKAIVSDSRVFILSPNIDLYIEVANSFNNSLYDSMGYLNYLNKKLIDRFDLNTLVKNDDLRDSKNYIGNYLKLYKEGKLNEKEIKYNEIITLQSIPKNQLVEWFGEHIKQEDGASSNFILLNTFANILATSLRMMEECYFCSLDCINFNILELQANGLQAYRDEMAKLRTTFFEALLKTTKEFTTKSIKNVSKNQNDARGKNQDQLEKFIEKNECNVTWETAKHFAVLLDRDGGVQYLYRQTKDVPENIKKIIYIYMNAMIDGNILNTHIKNNNYTIPEFSSYSHIDFLHKLQTFSKRDLSKYPPSGNYILTPDNYLKMNLIYMRAESLIPIIIMGETGVGKTSLLRFFVEQILLDILKIFCIHAGTSLALISTQMENFSRCAIENSDKKVWVFFDEFNTNDNLALLCEIMVEREFQGNRVPDNLIFCAACNPYRKKNKKIIDHNVGIQRKRDNFDESNSLMHMVKPLPDSIINYIWDFGGLTENDLKKYIETILKVIHSKYERTFADLIAIAHNYFKDQEDCSSISLRDVQRFIRLYDWFKTSRRLRSIEAKNESYMANLESFNLNPKCPINDEELVSGILSFCHCYYLRISNENERNEIMQQISKVTLCKVEDLMNIIKAEQDDLFARMDLKSGTALNQALRENLFAIIPCILAKLPVLICGKPGCSKSLAISLVFSNLRGTKSHDEYFKTLPELIQISYQGSESCTSEGIEKVFEKAEKYLQTTGKNLLPVIVFDEIGLAEISSCNPLKVLHSLLELENVKVGFVAISNWRLDASKMNRVLYLARPDPTNKELEFTAKSISESICKNLKHQDVILKLSQCYNDLKLHMANQEHSDFYGLRDFYNLIKQVSRWLNKYTGDNKLEIANCCKYAIERNFGGLEDKSDFVWHNFCEKYNIVDQYKFIEDSKTIDLIMNNFEDENSRFLMIICNKEVGTYILEKNLKSTLKDYKFIVGSSLEEDIKNEDYAFNCLSSFILDMEKGKCVVLNGIDQIYSSLYDVFNQNYSIQGERKYCRVALGAFFNPRCFVNKDFRVVIFLDDDEDVILKTDAPFLNRFEKHRLTFSCFLSKLENYAVEVLENWVRSICAKENSKICKKRMLFPTYSKESIKLLVSNHFSGNINEENKGEVIDKCKKDLLMAAPTDILISTELNQALDNEKVFIKTVWRSQHELPFYKFLYQEIYENKHQRIMVLTYQNERIGKIFTDDDQFICKKQFAGFKSDKDFEKDMRSFFAGPLKMCIIEIEFSLEYSHLNYLKFKVENLLKERETDKQICIISVLSRMNLTKAVPLFRDWLQIMYDELEVENSEDEKDNKLAGFKITDDILGLSTEELILNKNIINLSKNVSIVIENSLTKFNPEGQNASDYYNYINFIVSKIRNESELIGAFEEKVRVFFKKPDLKFDDWKTRLFDSEGRYSRDAQTALFEFINSIIEDGIFRLIYSIEKEQAFPSYFYEKDQEDGELIKKIWRQYFKDMDFLQEIQLQNLKSSTKMKKYAFTLNFPFSNIEYRKILKLYQAYNDSEDNQKKIIFFEDFKKTSVIGSEHLNRIKSHPQVVELYFLDLIQIFLNENNLDSKAKELFYLLLTNSYHPDDNIESKVLMFMEMTNIFTSLAYVIALTETYKKNVYKGLCDTLAESVEIIDERLKDFFDKRADEKIKELDEKSQDEEYREDDEDRENEEEIYFIEKNRLALQIVVEKICCLLFPERELLDKITEAAYLSLIKKISIMLNTFIDIQELKIQSYSALQFISKALGLCFLLGLSIYQIYDISIQEGILNISDPSCKEKLFYYIDTKKIEDIDETFKFKMYCYNLLIQENSELLPIVADEIRKNNSWKFCKLFIDICISSIEVINQLKMYENYALGKVDEKSELKFDKNEYYIEIDKIVIEKGFEDKFVILLSDSIQNIKSYDRKMPKDLYKLIRSYIKDFRNYNKSNLKKLIIISKTKAVLLAYIRKLVEDEDTDDAHMQNIDKMLISTQGTEVFILYCAKMYQKMKNLTYSDMVEKISRSDTEWLKYSDLIDEQRNVTVYPFTPEVSKVYTTLIQDIKNDVIKGTENVKNQLLAKPDLALSLALVYMNEVFIFYRVRGVKSIDHYRKWYNKNEVFLGKNIGEPYAKVIKCFLNNFPEGSLLRIQPDHEINSFNQIILECYVFLTIISYSKFKSPLTSIFFDESGKVYREIDVSINSHYIIADYPKHQLIDCRMKFKEYDSMKEENVYKCSKICDYIYFGGKPVKIIKCKYDKVDIGGLNHELVQRNGHKKITDDEAKNHLKTCIQKYEIISRKGYHIKKFEDENSNEQKYVSNIKIIGFYYLNLLIKSSMHMFIELETISTLSSIEKMFKLSKKFTDAEKDKYRNSNFRVLFFEQIQANLKRIQDELINLGCNNIYCWLYSLIGQIPELIISNKNYTDTSVYISEFEKTFETIVLNPALNDVPKIVLDYNNMLLKDNPITKESLLNETKIDIEKYPLSKLFRVTREPDRNSIETIFKNQISLEKISSQFSLVKIFFDIENNAKKLESLFPIIEFSNHMLEMFNHMIPREEARTKSIKEFLDEKTKNLWENFKIAWENVNESDLAFDCYRLEKPEITEESPLSMVLIDNKDRNGGMCLAAVIIKLSNIQNQELKHILKSIDLIANDKSILDDFKYSPQSLKEENIIDFSFIDPEKLMKYYINNPEYGKGTEILYDFDKIQNFMIADICKKKFINPTKINFIHYQFELLSGEDSSVIIDIRVNIKQETLNLENIRAYEKFFENLKDKKTTFNTEIRNIYSSISLVMFNLKGSREKPEETLIDFCNKLKIGKNNSISLHILDQSNPFAKTELRYIVNVFTIVESNYFNHFCKEILRNEYKDKTQNELFENLIEDLNKNSNRYPKVTEIKDAIMRFLLRYSVAKLEVKESLSFDIQRNDLWPENMHKEKLLNIGNFIKQWNILISSSYCFYISLDEFTKRLKDKSNKIDTERERKEKEEEEKRKKNKDKHKAVSKKNKGKSSKKLKKHNLN
ncbi:hypothetical protein SteCoe_6230 [Stentor coeruleus]|uniref:AAA+ ATPase domain-containing protein n=1 Tax=Stentor coeruleus TaxID=5963 RepID=A0A1R2CQJ5_9CILI|nr:hypothetical protein SteCoe_6230 [Stentor coeruleus]